MTDVKSSEQLASCARKYTHCEEELRQTIEMLYFAYRDFTSGSDEILKEYGFGRAHHRAIYFVGRNPGLTVSNLLEILKITKQSLNRVLSQLVRDGFIEQRPGSIDRRHRLLTLTEKGKDLENRLTENQRDRISGAYTAAGRSSVKGFRKVLIGIMSDAENLSRFD